MPGTTGWTSNFDGRPAVLLNPLPFDYTTNAGSITITGYTGIGGALVVPDTINALPVTTIGEYAFSNMTKLTSVTIPDSVTRIEAEAFYECSGLTSVTISDGVTSIGEYAFEHCGGLTSVMIPNSVTNIGEGPFAFCTNLCEITVATNNSFYSSLDGVLFDTNQTTLIECPCAIAGIYSIPTNVASIGNSALAGCSDLVSVTIPDTVTNMGEDTFAICGSLTNIGQDAFALCAKMTNATIANGVTSIGDFAFYNCTQLINITIPASVTNIADDAFYFCSSLTSVFFTGNAPTADSTVFTADDTAIAYYLPGMTGWSDTFAGIPTALWFLPHPAILNSGSSLGVQSNAFGFTVSWATNTSLVVEASTNLANPVWIPLQTNTLTNGSFSFSDPQWTNFPGRFYRLSFP